MELVDGTDAVATCFNNSSLYNFVRKFHGTSNVNSAEVEVSREGAKKRKAKGEKG